MAITYWHKQSPETPLYADLVWSRPENKLTAGKLLIIGGNKFGFAAPAEAYVMASAAGVGSTRVLLPQAIKKLAGALLPGLEYAASTPSGSFALAGLGEFLALASWADGVLLAGDMGHNSETAILLESFLDKFEGQVTVTKDAANYCLTNPQVALNRSETLLVLTMAGLQKMATNARFLLAFKTGMDLLHLVETLHEFTLKYPAKIIVKHQNQLVVAASGEITTTKTTSDQTTPWRLKTATHASVWWLQNPAKPLEALTTAIFT